MIDLGQAKKLTLEDDFGARETLGGCFDITVLGANRRAELFEAFNVEVDRPCADGAAAGQGHASAAGAREKGSENQHRSAHRFNEIVGSLMREDLLGSKAGGMVFFQFHAGAQLAKQSAGRIDVVHEGDVLEDNFALGQ